MILESCADCGHEEEHHVGPQGSAPKSCVMCEVEKDDAVYYPHDYIPGQTCRLCAGSGAYWTLRDDPSLKKPCPSCEGSGFIVGAPTSALRVIGDER